MPANDDSRLVAAALGGDRSAFALLIERYRARVQALASSMLGNREEAEDVTQETLLRAYLGLAELREPARFGSWLCGIAVNLARMRLRRGRADRLSLEDLTGGRSVPAATAPSPQQAVEALEQLELVRAALAVLPAGQRDVVLMHYVGGLSCEEIAALVGRSNGAVRVRLHRARAQLRRQLRKEIEGMIEVEVEDVVVRVLTEKAEGELPRLASPMRVVLLKEKRGERVLPIWIGAIEGDALALAFRGELGLRPLSADLMARLLEVTGGRIERVVVASLREKTFYATVSVAADGRSKDLDARPSDAINLAVRTGAPIFVADEVMATCGSTGAEALEAEAAKVEPELPPSAWRSLSAEMVKSLWEATIPK